MIQAAAASATTFKAKVGDDHLTRLLKIGSIS